MILIVVLTIMSFFVTVCKKSKKFFTEDKDSEFQGSDLDFEIDDDGAKSEENEERYLGEWQIDIPD